MKKVTFSIISVILGIFFLFLFLLDRETSLEKERFVEDIDLSKVSEIEILQSIGSEEKEIILEGEEARNLFKKLATSPLTKESKNDLELQDSYWLLIRSSGRSVLGIRIDNTLRFSPNSPNGHKHNNKNYELLHVDVLKEIQDLF